MFKLTYNTDKEQLQWVHKYDKNIVLDLMDKKATYTLNQEIVHKLNAHHLEPFDQTMIPKSVWDGLHQSQKEGVEFIVKQGGRALIADQMGTGKTRQAIASSFCFPDVDKFLVVCPASLCTNWENEWKVIDPSKNIQVIKTTKDKIKPDTNVVILSYGKTISSIFEEELTGTYWGFIIFDECHNIKSKTAKRTKYAIALSANADHVLLMSGTPMNKPVDMYTMAKCVRPKLFTRFYHEFDKGKFYFSNRYCQPRKVKFGAYMPVQTVHDGAANLVELNAILSHMMLICRVKDDVMDLPEKVRESVVIGSLSHHWYKKNKKYLEDTNMVDKNKHDAQFMRMVMETSKKKVKHSIEYFKSVVMPMMQEDEKMKIIIFGHYTENLCQLIDFIDNKTEHDFIAIDGRTPANLRQGLVDKFQQHSKCRVAILSIKACGAGLTLTAASRVFFTDILYNPEDCLQAEDRAHRYGQNQQVTVTYLMMNNSTDEMLFNMIMRKYNTCAKVIENKNKKLDVIKIDEQPKQPEYNSNGTMDL